MCTPFRVSFSPLFSSAGYRKKAIFLEPVVKRVYFLKTGCCLARFLRFGVYFSPIFSRIGYRSEGKILEPGKNVCLWWAHPRTIESQVPPPPENKPKVGKPSQKNKKQPTYKKTSTYKKKYDFILKPSNRSQR